MLCDASEQFHILWQLLNLIVGRAAVPAIPALFDATCHSLAAMAGTAARPTVFGS
jgi:hypothetical protein